MNILSVWGMKSLFNVELFAIVSLDWHFQAH